jgi:hypothetical protein
MKKGSQVCLARAFFPRDTLMFVPSLDNLLALKIKVKKACAVDSLYFFWLLFFVRVAQTVWTLSVEPSQRR